MNLKECINSFSINQLKYGLSDGVFSHNLNCDYAIFAIWNDARSVDSGIKRHLSNNFHILAAIEIQWSKKYFHLNAFRLYEDIIPHSGIEKPVESSHVNKIGSTNFKIYIIKDVNPRYTYFKSVSGKIELSNKKVVECKRLFRSWVEMPYRVHSSNNVEEFFMQSSLILGTSLLTQILNESNSVISFLEKDLEGANGWASWDEIFDILRFCSNYLVLRNFDSLPTTDEDDIDFLCDNYQRLASSLNMYQFDSRATPYKGCILLNNILIPVDIRFIGDNYYDTTWSASMLASKVIYKGYFIPREDHVFFSLLYHGKVHKKEIKKTYKNLLIKIAKNLDFDWFAENINIFEDKEVASILAGYMEANGYSYSPPVDKGVNLNPPVIKRLPHLNNRTFVYALLHRTYNKLLLGLRKILPSKFKKMIKIILNKLIN